MNVLSQRSRFMRSVRIAMILFLGVVTLPAMIGLPAAADAAERPQTVARLQIHFDTVTIHDDREGWLSGQGEFGVAADVWRCVSGTPPPCLDQHEDNGGQPKSITTWGTTQWGYSGDVIALNRTVPGGPAGFAVYSGYQYVLRVHMNEEDEPHLNLGEDMGDAYFALDTGAHGLGIGTHTVRSVRSDGVSAGDFSITFEVRRAQVPDLRPGGITVQHPPLNANDQVCIGVTNHEVHDAGPFEVHLLVNGSLPAGGRFSVDGLKGGTGATLCADTLLPVTGQHSLAASVDVLHTVAEYDETNNYVEMEYTPRSPSTNTQSSATGKVDLTVSAIKLNGQVPDGKDDCRAGKNLVTVTVKNGGKGTAGLFTTRLTVDGVDVAEQLAVDLEAGKEQEVRFEGVQLKKGEHKLTVLADANSQVAETDEGNNPLTVTAACRAA